MRCHDPHARCSYPAVLSGIRLLFVSLPHLRELPDSHIWVCSPRIALSQPPALAKAGVAPASACPRSEAGAGGRLPAWRAPVGLRPPLPQAESGPHPALSRERERGIRALDPFRRSSIPPHPECRSPIPFRSTSFPPSRCWPARSGGTLIRAYPARPRLRAFRGGANRAPDCPGAPARASPNAGRTPPAGSPGAFSRGRLEHGEAAPRGCRPFLQPHIGADAVKSSKLRNISEITNKHLTPRPGEETTGMLPPLAGQHGRTH